MSDYEVSGLPWSGAERRQIDSVALGMMVEFRKQLETHEEKERAVLDELKDEIRENRASSERRHDELASRFQQMQQSTMTLIQTNNTTVNEIHAMFKKAFPNGDAESHRRAHEAWIEKDKAEREFWMHLKKQVVGWGFTAAIAWAAMLVWAGFLKGPAG